MFAYVNIGVSANVNIETHSRYDTGRYRCIQGWLHAGPISEMEWRYW